LLRDNSENSRVYLIDGKAANLGQHPQHVSSARRHILIEFRVAVDNLQLTGMGHVLDVRGAYSSAMGRDQAILVDTASGMHFASDPRADGSAEPEPPPHP
jgi:hypothetical protein